MKVDFKVAEKFVSINGEGLRSGQLAVFIRLAGCNLNCSYCDTAWANKEDTLYNRMSEEEIYQYILTTGVTNITLTGGEPLLAEDILVLLETLAKDKTLYIEIETNGSVALESFMQIENPPSFTMDYKLPSSDMENHMVLDNFNYLTKKDTIKFVCGSLLDLEKAKQMTEKFCLNKKTNVYISPIFGAIEPEEIVDFMKENQMNSVTLQLQMHKIIWDKDKRGV
jgi:7-carboxy-7-deazaguanine synthase